MGVTAKKEEAMVPITSLSRPTALDFDARSQFIYYSDVQRFVIERQTINGSKREVFLDKGLNNCEGLAIDWMGRNLYWTDEGLLSVFVARLDNSEIKKRLVYGNMSHPRAIVVDPKRGYESYKSIFLSNLIIVFRNFVSSSFSEQKKIFNTIMNLNFGSLIVICIGPTGQQNHELNLNLNLEAK
jgi:hypothetical protein